ncbi:hypothetical protein LSCM1_02400 [Leishmania martiniquensis]|uniref:Uncharacterized protein n=1 Tax=Leishmania martiniquensis TaxID=1580590 RepID=A0A836GMR7_9TRYP|nr:hypothetical protein LSCM1_02400 [Leishmania martiniquensis]
MHFSEASWMRHSEASLAAQELNSLPHTDGNSSARRCEPPSGQHKRANAFAAAHVHASSSETGVAGHAGLCTRRRRGALLAELQCLCAKANAILVERWFLRWGLYAVRRAALKSIQYRAQAVLWRRVGSRCFSWWRLVTERRMCREVLHQEAAMRERVTLMDGICRVAWDKWRRWARATAWQRARAKRLGLVNRERHVQFRYYMWTRFPRRCRQVRAVEQIRFSAERSLARFTLTRWQLHTLESYLTFPLQVRSAQQVAAVAFCAWQRRARTRAHLRLIHQEALLNLAQSGFARWKWWLQRRIQAALLRKANEDRLVRRIFSHWVWQHQLRALDYERYIALHHLPRLFS